MRKSRRRKKNLVQFQSVLYHLFDQFETEMNNYLGVKPYKCPICDAQFNRPANLKTHLRIHSGEKPYKCDTCSARFVQVAHLRAHMLIHTGEKPYPCQICGTRYLLIMNIRLKYLFSFEITDICCVKCHYLTFSFAGSGICKH